MPAAAKLFSLFAQRHVGLSALAVIWTSVSTWHWFCKCSCSLCPGFPKCWLFTCRFSRCDWYHRFGCRRIGSVAKTWCGWMHRVLANKEEAVNPPNTQQERKVATSIKVQSRKLVSLRASDQANIFAAVGTPMTRVVYEK